MSVPDCHCGCGGRITPKVVMVEINLRDEECEYGCDGRCEDLEHWKDRAEYWATVAMGE